MAGWEASKATSGLFKEQEPAFLFTQSRHVSANGAACKYMQAWHSFPWETALSAAAPVLAAGAWVAQTELELNRPACTTNLTLPPVYTTESVRVDALHKKQRDHR